MKYSLPKNMKKRDFLCNYSEVVEKTDVKTIPFYGSLSCSYYYSSAAAAEWITEAPITAAATDYITDTKHRASGTCVNIEKEME